MNLNGKIFAAGAASFGAFLGIIIFVAVPLVGDIQNVRAQIVERQIETVEYEDRIFWVRQFRGFAKQESENFSKLDNVLVDSQMPLGFIDYLEEAAFDSGIKVNFSPLVTRRELDEEWPSLGFQIDAVGDIEGILMFTKKIETGPYLVNIEGFNVEAGIDDTEVKENAINAVENAGKAHILLRAYAKEQ